MKETPTKCNNATIEWRVDLRRVPTIPVLHDGRIQHICEIDKDHEAEHCVCRCGYYWKKAETVTDEPKDSIGE